MIEAAGVEGQCTEKPFRQHKFPPTNPTMRRLPRFMKPRCLFIKFLAYTIALAPEKLFRDAENRCSRLRTPVESGNWCVHLRSQLKIRTRGFLRWIIR